MEQTNQTEQLQNDADNSEPSLADTIYLGLPLPEVQGQILITNALVMETISVLLQTNILTGEQMENILRRVSERKEKYLQSLTENASVPATHELVDRMRTAADARLDVVIRHFKEVRPTDEA